MIEYNNSRAVRIVGPDTTVLTRDALPPANTTRWVASRKAQVVAAVQGGLLSLEEVLARYNLSVEEFYGWQWAMDRAGVSGLKVGWASRERANRRHH